MNASFLLRQKTSLLRGTIAILGDTDAVITGRSTFFYPYRLTLRLLLVCKAIEMVFIVFVEPLRKNPVWTLSDFVKIQKIFEPLRSPMHIRVHW